jgi:hypothetical protein
MISIMRVFICVPSGKSALPSLYSQGSCGNVLVPHNISIKVCSQERVIFA